MNCKLIKIKKPYVDKKTNEKKIATNFYVELPNGVRVQISPTTYTNPNDGSKSSNYQVLNSLSELVEESESK